MKPLWRKPRVEAICTQFQIRWIDFSIICAISEEHGTLVGMSSILEKIAGPMALRCKGPFLTRFIKSFLDILRIRLRVLRIDSRNTLVCILQAFSFASS